MLRRTFLLLTLSIVANASLMQTIQEKNNVALTKDELIDLELQKNLKTFLDTYEKLKLIKVDNNYIKLRYNIHQNYIGEKYERKKTFK